MNVGLYTAPRRASRVASAITKGPVFRRGGGDRGRLRETFPPMPYDAIAGYARYWQETFKGKNARPRAHRLHHWDGFAWPTGRQRGLFSGGAKVFGQGLAKILITKPKAVRALLSHSLRVGLMPDLLRR